MAAKPRLKASDAPPARARKAQDRRELKKSTATRQRILDAGAKIFARKGFGRTLMSDIAAEVGIHVTALYYHFDTKDALAEATINHAVDLGYEEIREALEALPPTAGFHERVAAGVHVQLKGLIDRRDYVRAQSRVLSELPDDAQRRHRDKVRASTALWRSFFHDAAKSGELRGELDPGVARMVVAGSINWTIEWYRDGGHSLHEVADHITKIMLGGLTPASARKK